MGVLDRFNLLSLMTKYNLRYFIETGTGDGTSLDHSLKFSFDRYYSIELFKPIFDLALKKYEKDEDVELLNDNSEAGLTSILKELPKDKPCLYWLDAHFPGADYHYSDYNNENRSRIRIPLQAELEVIKENRPLNKDVILIDDLRIYEDGPFEAGNWDKRSTLGGNGIKFIFDLFDKTHNIERDFRDQGYIILTPKDI